MAASASPTPIPRAWHELLLLSLRHRPLLWIAPAVVLGCTLGPIFAAFTHATTREALVLLVPFALGLGCCFLAYRSWRYDQSDRARLTLFCALVGISIMLAARRALPPSDDLSVLVRAPLPLGPQHRVPIQVAGYVADFPDMGDFGTSFPLECVRIATGATLHPELNGRVWVDAPLDADVEVGDAISLNTELADLPRAGNPGERPPQMRFIAANCWCRTAIKHKEEIHIVQRAAAYPIERWVAGLRRRLLTHYEAAFNGSKGPLPSRPCPHATAQLLGAMVFGEGGLQDPLPPLTRNQFRAAGLSHILVASGQQVAYLLLILIAVTRALGLRRWWLIAIVLPVLLLYALLTGGGPSIWRATIAGLCIAWALLLGRDVDGLSLWSLALILILLLDPIQLFSISLQLTFAATWGLIALAPVLSRLLEKRPGPTRINELVSLSLGAQLATMPLLLYHFGRLSAAGVGANFFAVPLAGFLVGTGIAGLFLPFVNALNYPLTRGIAGLATLAASTPGAQATMAPGGLSWSLIFYSALLCASGLSGLSDTYGPALRDEFWRWCRRKWQNISALRPQGFITVLALVATVLVAWHTATTHTPWLRVTLLDVGQGESIVVHAPSGRTVLIDGGSLSDEGRGDVGRAIIAPYLQSLGVHALDAMVITHADADHCNALAAVLDEIPVGLALDGGFKPGNLLHHETTSMKGKTQSDQAGHGDEYESLKKLLRERGVPIYPAHAGQRLNLGDGITLTMLAPLQPLFRSDNNNAAVLRLDYGTTSMLFTADIEHEAEERLVRRGVPLRCTILKVAHHGSKTSTSIPLLNAAHPQAAILSCGRYNGFGHPAPQTMNRLAQRHVPVYRTDAEGAIEVFSNGQACWIQTFR